MHVVQYWMLCNKNKFWILFRVVLWPIPPREGNGMEDFLSELHYIKVSDVEYIESGGGGGRTRLIKRKKRKSDVTRRREKLCGGGGGGGEQFG